MHIGIADSVNQEQIAQDMHSDLGSPLFRKKVASKMSKFGFCSIGLRFLVNLLHSVPNQKKKSVESAGMAFVNGANVRNK